MPPLGLEKISIPEKSEEELAQEARLARISKEAYEKANQLCLFKRRSPGLAGPAHSAPETYYQSVDQLGTNTYTCAALVRDLDGISFFATECTRLDAETFDFLDIDDENRIDICHGYIEADSNYSVVPNARLYGNNPNTAQKLTVAEWMLDTVNQVAADIGYSFEPQLA